MLSQHPGVRPASAEMGRAACPAESYTTKKGRPIVLGVLDHAEFANWNCEETISPSLIPAFERAVDDLVLDGADVLALAALAALLAHTGDFVHIVGHGSLKG